MPMSLGRARRQSLNGRHHPKAIFAGDVDLVNRMPRDEAYPCHQTMSKLYGYLKSVSPPYPP